MMELLLISEYNAHAPRRKMSQDFFATNLNKVTIALSKEEDNDDNNEDNINDAGGRSDAIPQAVAEIAQEAEGNVANEMENDNRNECTNENLENKF